MNSIPRVWGGPRNGEACDACELIVTKDEFLMEGISLAEGRGALQLHVECFHLWELERRAAAMVSGSSRSHLDPGVKPTPH